MVETLQPSVDPATMRESFLRNGAVVIEGVVPDPVCDAVIAATEQFATTFPRGPDRPMGHGIVPLHHHAALWQLRTLSSVHAVFAAIHETPELLVSVDRVSFKPPDVEGREKRSPIHWDCDPFEMTGLGTQGVVYLTDTPEEQGPFCCVPDIYRNLEAYRAEHRDNPERQRPQYAEDQVVPVPGKRGSLVVFHRLMPHSSEVNRGGAPRYTQYVAMGPGSEAARAETARLWRTRMPPEWAVRQKVPHQQMPEPGNAVLTELGQRLAGLRDW